MNMLHRAVMAFGVGALLTGSLTYVREVRTTAQERIASSRTAALSNVAADEDNSVMPAGVMPVDGLLLSGSRLESDANEPLPPPSRIDEVLEIFNADLGDEGIPVDRQELEEALRVDLELRSAIFE